MKHHSIYMLRRQRKVCSALFSLQAKWCMGDFHHQIMKAGFRKGCLFPLGEGGLLPSSRVMVCATGWGRTFTTGLAIMGLHFHKSY